MNVNHPISVVKIASKASEKSIDPEQIHSGFKNGVLAPVLQDAHTSNSNAENSNMSISTLITSKSSSAYHEKALSFKDVLHGMGILKSSRIIKSTEMPSNTEQLPLTTEQYDSPDVVDSEKQYDVSESKVLDDLSNFSTSEDLTARAAAQSDTHTSLNKISKEKDIRSGYMELNPRDFGKERGKAFDWLMKTRDSEYGWGDDTARALLAAHMLDEDSLKKQHDERMLMSKQLHLTIFKTLMK